MPDITFASNGSTAPGYLATPARDLAWRRTLDFLDSHLR